MLTGEIKKYLLLTIVLFAWFSLIAQFVLIIQNRVASIPETILRFFCYFTILSNILVALTVTFQLLQTNTNVANFFRRQSAMAAAAVNIIVVCIVYNIILRGLVEMKGLQRVVDELLHVATPILYFIFWVLFAYKDQLKWKNAFAWLQFPLIYLIAVMVVGALLASRFYPYPFLDAYNHGYSKVVKSSLIIMILFLLLSFIFIGLARYITSKANKN